MAVGAVVARILTQYSDKGSKAARKDINKLGKDFDQFAKRSAQAFGLAAAATAAFAIKVGTDAVQAAIEDQKSQTILANSLRNTIGATDDAIASTERYIAKQQMLVGVADTELRQSLITLTNATNDLSQAQALQNIALDVAASGYGNVESVSKALAKAYTGNLGALKKLVPGISDTIVKTKDLDGAMKFLSDTFGGAAAASADTLEGRLRILKLSYDEILETLGFALLPVVQEFAEYLQTNVLPRIQEWIDANKDELAAGLRSVAGTLKTVIERAVALGQWITDNTGKVKAFGVLLGAMFAVGAVAKFVVAINTITAALVVLRTTAIGTAIATAFATGGISVGTTLAALAGIGVTAVAATAALNSQSGAAEQVTKATGKLNSSHASSLKLNKDFVISNTKLNTTLDGTTKKTKELTAEQKKALEVQAQLAKYGVNTKENDPIQLEAARLNLLKQQAIGIEAIGNASWDLLEAQFANNVQAQRYADILAVINDNKISTIEVDALAAKWGKSTGFVLDYIAKVTGIKNIVVDKDFGADAAKGWDKARTELEKYLALLGAGSISPEVQAVVSETDAATAAAEAAVRDAEAALAAAEAASRAADEYLAGLGIKSGAPTSGAISGFSPSSQYGSQTLSPGSPGFVGPTAINVTVNTGNLIGGKEELVDAVRQGILANQLSGKIIQLEALSL
jgi:hypothetical protein